MREDADAIDALTLEALAAAGDWLAFFSAIRDGGERLARDVGLLSAAFRIAGTADREDAVLGFRDIRVAILRNATVEPWLPHAFAALVRRGLIPRFWLGDYAVYEGYLMGTQPGWPEAEPDVTFLYLDPEELVGDGAFLVDAALPGAIAERLSSLLSLAADSGRPTVVSNLTPPAHGFRTVLDSQLRSSWPNVRQELNLLIVEKAETHPSLVVLDLDGPASRIGASNARDTGLYLGSHVPFGRDFMPVIADAFAAVVAPIFLPPRKCVVVDADNTLWGGVLGEDGPEGVKVGLEYPGSLYRRFQLFLKALIDQGTLVALNSKNNESDVVDFLGSSPDMVLREKDFAARRINWGDKASNIRGLAADLNIGLDAMVFVDDSAVECELVRTLLPEVLVQEFPTAPLGIPDFIERFPDVGVLRVTAEDRARAESIRSNVQREKLRTEAGDLDSFIRSLEIQLHIRCQPTDLVQRIAQLTQRTNQFNLTTRRYTDDDIRSLMAATLVVTLAMADKFSDYGTIGLALVRMEGSEAEIDTLLLSCRAFGREIELVFVDEILKVLVARGVGMVLADYLPTGKNAMVADFWEKCGFERVSGADGPVRFRRELRDLTPAGIASRYVINSEGCE